MAAVYPPALRFAGERPGILLDRQERAHHGPGTSLEGGYDVVDAVPEARLRVAQDFESWESEEVTAQSRRDD